MHQIGQHNIREYLAFLNKKQSYQFPADLIDKWSAQDDVAIEKLLTQFYLRIGMPPQQIEEWHQEFFKTTEETRPFIIEKDNPSTSITNPTPTITPPPIDQIETIDAEIIEDTNSATPPPMPKTSIYVPDEYVVPKKSKVRWGIWLSLVALTLLGAYTLYSYIQYDKLGYVYALADNISVRDSDVESGEILDGLSLYGEFVRKDGTTEVHKSKMKLIEDDDLSNYYTVQLEEDFFRYLLGNSNIGYVHKKYVTTSRSKHEAYRQLFQELANTPKGLNNLLFVYREMIYQATQTNSEIMNLKVATPCPLDEAQEKKWTNIGQFTARDNNNNVTRRYAMVQLSNGYYYNIEANANGDVQNVTKMVLDGGTGTEPMQTKGMFRYEDPFNNTYGNFIWRSCDGNLTAKSSLQPFNIFSLQ